MTVSVFRSPLYLDEEIMVPLANYHDIEVMTDIAISQRDRGERSGRAALRVTAPVPGSPGVELGGSRGSESELTQERTVKAHPTDALNRLLDALHRKEELSTNLADEVVTRHQVVEVDGDWDVAPATDVGNLLTSVVAAFVANPAAAQSSEPPPELVASLMGTQRVSGMVTDVTYWPGCDDSG